MLVIDCLYWVQKRKSDHKERLKKVNIYSLERRAMCSDVMESFALWNGDNTYDKKRQEAEFRVAELKMLRFLPGVTRLDKINNEHLRGTEHARQVGDKARETKSRAKLRWSGHVMGRDEEYVKRRMLDVNPPGRRKRWRPIIRFMDVLQDSMRVVGVTLEDRGRWRQVTSSGNP